MKNIKNGSTYKDKSFFNLDYISYLWFCSDGRIGRKQYILGSLMFWLLSTITFIAVMFITSGLDKIGTDFAAAGIFSILLFAMAILGSIVTFMLAIKRVHDLGQSGWMSLLFLVPIVSFFFTIWLVFFKGMENENQYGVPVI